MAFDQNQQDQFNMNNGIDQVKQFQAELDKAAASIGAAELEAEEELLGIRLKNLSKVQQTKLTQLGQMLELEEKSIQELAKLKLTLSNRQFAVRKKEIQKEFQEYKAAADEFFKAESKRKSTKASSSSKKSTEDLKASNKSNKAANAAIQKASKKVQTAIYGVNKLSQDISEAIASLQDVASENQKLQKETKKTSTSTAIAATSQVNTTSTAEDARAKAEIKAQEEKQYSNEANSMDEVDLGKYSAQKVFSLFDGLRDDLEKNPKNKSILTDLNKIMATMTEKKDKDGNVVKDEAGNVIHESSTSQTTLDITGSLLNGIKAANEAEARLNAFKAEGAEGDLTRRLALAEAEHKLREDHANKEHELINKGIAEEAKARDLQNNRAAYEQEARLELENELAANRNRLAEDIIKQEEALKFRAAHADELMAEELHKKQLGYAQDYAAYLEEAGKYAVSREAFEKNKKQKELASAKENATSGIVDAIKTGQFSKIWSADNKEAYTKYMGLRAAELEESYMAKFDKANPKATEKERAEAKEKAEASAKLTAQFELVAEAAGNLARELNAQTDKIGSKQAPIDTRLQGSTANEKILGSYWKQLARDMNKIGAVNPYFTQEDFASNIETLVNKGISFDIKQRAFLMTIQEKIANTFDAADGTLLRLVRIQQQDTTAGRLGMESALNSFLNSMYETSEYLTDVASSVRGSLEEMQALMEGAAGTELEFQVQKWMGSLYSVGMSQEAVQNIAQTFGQIASGDVGGLTGNGTSNLLIMAANEAGLSIAEILQEGLDAKNTNKLMQAMVNYLAEIAEASSDSRVVQQQFANVFGVKASDLKAATNLASSIKDVSNQDLTYGGMLGQLNKMANSMSLRTSTGEFFSNIWNNVQYTMATQMANDPILYLLPRVATLLEDYAGGIDLPFISAFGTGVDLNTSVAQLMNVAALSGSILGSLGPMISGLGSAVSGSIMLSQAGINTSGKAPVIARGSAPVLQHLGGSSISESGYVGQGDGKAVKEQTLQDADDSSKKQLVEAKDEESTADISIRANQAVIDMYNLLEEVAHGTQSLRVKIVEDLTKGSNKEPGNWLLSF